MRSKADETLVIVFPNSSNLRYPLAVVNHLHIKLFKDVIKQNR